MAVSYEGVSSILEVSSANSSQSITVPADAEFALICLGGYTWANNGSGTSFTLAGQGATFVEDGGTFEGEDEQTLVFRVDGFSTGSQTLAWNIDGSVFDGYHLFVLFFSGVDETTPIADTGTSTSTSISIALSGASGDMGALVISDYANNPSSAGSGQTVVVNTGAYNTNYMDACHEAATGATTTLTGSGGGDHSAVGVLLAAAEEEEVARRIFITHT